VARAAPRLFVPEEAKIQPVANIPPKAGQIKVAVEFISAASFFCCLRFARTDTSKHVLQPLRRWQVRQTASFDPRLNHGFNETVGHVRLECDPMLGLPRLVKWSAAEI
jgi:hypothetical protein